MAFGAESVRHDGRRYRAHPLSSSSVYPVYSRVPVYRDAIDSYRLIEIRIMGKPISDRPSLRSEESVFVGVIRHRRNSFSRLVMVISIRCGISIGTWLAGNDNPTGQRCVTLRISLAIGFSDNGYSLTLIGRPLDGTNWSIRRTRSFLEGSISRRSRQPR